MPCPGGRGPRKSGQASGFSYSGNTQSIDTLKAGCDTARATAGDTLGDVRRAMQIDYFENGTLTI